MVTVSSKESKVYRSQVLVLAGVYSTGFLAVAGQHPVL